MYPIFPIYKTMTQEFQQSIREWVSLDNQIKALNEQVKELRNKRQHVSTNIMSISEQHGYDDVTINISDGTLKVTDVRTAGTLTLQYIKSCLMECLNDEDKVEDIMDYIKENRPVKNTRDIKRVIKNKTTKPV